MIKNTTYNIICDESRQTKDRFMVLGGIIIDQKEIDLFDKTMKKYRSETKMFAELKWSKVSNQKLEEYKKFIDFFFALNNNDKIHFKVVIIDTHQLNHKKYNNGDKELGFYKFYYQLLLHSFGRMYYNNNVKFIVKLDKRNTSYKLGDLKYILNKGIAKRYGFSSNPFVSVESVDSKKSEIMQINDLLIGAIGYKKNDFHLLAGSKKAKIELMEYIEEKTGLQSFTIGTNYSQRRFSVWNFALKK